MYDDQVAWLVDRLAGCEMVKATRIGRSEVHWLRVSRAGGSPRQDWQILLTTAEEEHLCAY
jgi:hypothetical protein